MNYTSIKPGQVWLDTNGKPIQAHGFSVFYNENNGLYYWYGENTSKSTYVWLPIEWDGDKPMIRWYDEWKIEDFI